MSTLRKRLLSGMAIVAWLAAAWGAFQFFRLGDAEVVYYNREYDLIFKLPSDWRGYTTTIEGWEARKVQRGSDQEVVAGRGPVIVLRHPSWRTNDLYQDIPIQVFTRAQWMSGQQEFTSAGGVENEVSHNDRYVFSINSRFNVDDSVKGWQEANSIVQQNMKGMTPLSRER